MYAVVADERPSWPRAMRKVPNSRAPLTELPIEKVASTLEVDIYAAAKDAEALRGIGDIIRRRRRAANLFPEALPPYAPFVAPKMSEAPWAS